jgi:adenylate cyclase
VGAKLTITPSTAPAFEVEIGNTATIGRTRENTVCLSFSPKTSRQHALLRRHNDRQYQLVDLGSRNGTFVENQRVIIPVNIFDGTSIRIDDTLMVFSQNDHDTDENVVQTMRGTHDFALPETVPAALLVCDIRGFSTKAEQLAGPELAQLIGGWFREAGNLMNSHGGTIDKFIGDALLGYWGHTGREAEDCHAALEAGRALLTLAAGKAWPDASPFRIVVVLHQGPVTCGNVGLAAERDATIMGDAVNTVFALESISKELGRTLLCSGDFHDLVAGRATFHDFGQRTFKGKAQPVRIFGVDE